MFKDNGTYLSIADRALFLHLTCQMQHSKNHFSHMEIGNDIPTYIPTSVIKSAKILASKCIAYFNVVILTLILHSSEKST